MPLRKLDRSPSNYYVFARLMEVLCIGWLDVVARLPEMVASRGGRVGFTQEWPVDKKWRMLDVYVSMPI